MFKKLFYFGFLLARRVPEIMTFSEKINISKILLLMTSGDLNIDLGKNLLKYFQKNFNELRNAVSVSRYDPRLRPLEAEIIKVFNHAFLADSGKSNGQEGSE